MKLSYMALIALIPLCGCGSNNPSGPGFPPIGPQLDAMNAATFRQVSGESDAKEIRRSNRHHRGDGDRDDHEHCLVTVATASGSGNRMVLRDVGDSDDGCAIHNRRITLYCNPDMTCISRPHHGGPSRYQAVIVPPDAFVLSVNREDHSMHYKFIREN